MGDFLEVFPPCGGQLGADRDKQVFLGREVVIERTSGKIAAAGNGRHLHAQQAFIAKLLSGCLNKELFSFC